MSVVLVRTQGVLVATSEECRALQVQIDSLVQERESLLACNLELQQKIRGQVEIIKALSPYQVIGSRMPWGKN